MTLWYREVYEDESSYGLRVKRTLHSAQSDFQYVEVIDTVQLGRVLVIDGIFMTSERDEHFYHEMLVHPALVTTPAARVLVIGGGDGGTVRQLMRHPDVTEVVMVEIDGAVVEACKEHMPALGTWDDPRLELVIGDGIAYVRDRDVAPFDVILLDGTDPVGPGEGLFNREFYADVARLLAPNGVFALQSESPILMPKLFGEIVTTLRELFPRVHPYFGPVPLYAAGIWSWTYASKGADPMAIDDQRLAAIEAGCKQYNRDIHRGAFALPNYVRQLLD
jgi:spermidine synthase